MTKSVIRGRRVVFHRFLWRRLVTLSCGHRLLVWPVNPCPLFAVCPKCRKSGYHSI